MSWSRGEQGGGDGPESVLSREERRETRAVEIDVIALVAFIGDLRVTEGVFRDTKTSRMSLIAL